MSFKVVHTIAIPGKDLGESLLEKLNPVLIKGMWQTEEELIEQCKDADAVIGDISRKPFSRKVIEQLSNCRIIAGLGLGFESVDMAAANEHAIAVTNVPDYCLDEVSGRVIALLLALNYNILQANKAVKEKQLSMVPNMNVLLDEIGRNRRLKGQTLGIIGCSKIGTAAALKAKGLGMRVIAYDPFVYGGVLGTYGVEPVDMETLLAESDFISLHTPFSPATKGLIGYNEFSKMKPSCYFINTSRGGCVDEPGLIKALEEKKIAGAGLDVTINEPIKKDNPLIGMTNVILTGHSGWYSVDAEEELFRKPTQQVVLALQGQWPTYAQNPAIRNAWMEKWGK